MPRCYILNDYGEPEACDLLTWAAWFAGAHRVVCQDLLTGRLPASRILISTVFLGLDHSFTDHGPPVLWETLVFAEGHPDLDGLGHRYSSRDAAVVGHQRVYEQVRKALRR